MRKLNLEKKEKNEIHPLPSDISLKIRTDCQVISVNTSHTAFGLIPFLLLPSGGKIFDRKYLNADHLGDVLYNVLLRYSYKFLPSLKDLVRNIFLIH
jgi:hypothetical protein